MTSARADIGLDPSDKAAQRAMWDGWWYDRFEIPNAIPSDARRLELEMGGETFGAVLLDHVAPKTCQAFWEVLPYTGNMIHCAWFGHAAFYLDRVPLLECWATSWRTASSGSRPATSSGIPISRK